MSIFSELYETERIVREAEIAQPYIARPRSSIRERALGKMLLEAERPGFEDARASELGAQPLSPDTSASRTQSLALRQNAAERLRRQIDLVKNQDYWADADEQAFAKLSPLQQARRRDGWYRKSDLDRNTAVAGLLRRERRQRSPLTREAVGRAKSIDAARGALDAFVVTDADLEKAATGPLTSLELQNYQLIESRRRETLFAKRQIVAGGYPGPRASFKKMIKEVSCG